MYTYVLAEERKKIFSCPIPSLQRDERKQLGLIPMISEFPLAPFSHVSQNFHNRWFFGNINKLCWTHMWPVAFGSRDLCVSAWSLSYFLLSYNMINWSFRGRKCRKKQICFVEIRNFDIFENFLSHKNSEISYELDNHSDPFRLNWNEVWKQFRHFNVALLINQIHV